MSPEIREIYISARKNKEFLGDIKKADDDKKPSPFSTDFEKHIFAIMYYGWLVGKHGEWWKDYL